MSTTSKTFFKKLKDTVKKIDRESSEIKSKLFIPADDELASKKAAELQDKVDALRKEADVLENSIQPKLAHTRDFCNDFTELILEIEDSVSTQENYLKKYGYIPVNDIPECTPLPADDNEPCKNVTTPNEKGKEKRISVETTPDLLDYCISSKNFAEEYASGTVNGRKSSLEDLIIPKRTMIDELKSVENGFSLKSPLVEGVQVEADETTPTAPDVSVSASYTSFVMPVTPTLNLTSLRKGQ